MARIWRGGCIILGPVPEPNHRGVRAHAGSRAADLRRVLHRRHLHGAAGVAAGGRGGRAERDPDAGVRRPRWPTTTASGPSGSRRP